MCVCVYVYVYAESPDGVDPNIGRTRKTQRDGHNSGVKIWSLCSFPSTLSHANLWTTQCRLGSIPACMYICMYVFMQYECMYTYVYVLYFDPSPRPKNAIPRWYTGRKWHIPMASNRKRLRGRIKAYDMGQGEGPIVPLQWCTRRE